MKVDTTKNVSKEDTERSDTTQDDDFPPADNSADYIEKEEPVISDDDHEGSVIVKPEIVWGNRNKKQVIFTFDAGSGSQSLNKILSTLDKYSVKGTFFLTGKWAFQNQKATKQISLSGHEIFNHTYNHPYLTQVSDTVIVKEFTDTESLIKGLTGKTTKPFFRPPYGSRTQHVREVAAKEGYQSVYWTVDALDWKESTGTTAEQVKTRILSNLSPGVIYLMHVGDNITGDILDEVFSNIIEKGYKIVPLSQGIE